MEIKDIAKEITEYADFASVTARIDGVRFQPSAKDAKNIDELYKKTRNAHFSVEEKVKILLGNFVLLQENYQDYYVKARKILAGGK